MLWGALGRSGTFWGALGRSGPLWGALERSGGALWAALGRSGALIVIFNDLLYNFWILTILYIILVFERFDIQLLLSNDLLYSSEAHFGGTCSGPISKIFK